MCTIFKKNKLNNTQEIIRKIDKLKSSRNPNIYHYYFAFMVELKYGGFSLVDVGDIDFFNKNWRFMHNGYKQVQLKIYDLFLNNKNEFETLLSHLRTLAKSDEFIKRAEFAWFRFLYIKSLHDSAIEYVGYDSMNRQLVIKLNTRSAIDYIPFNDAIELRFQTVDFNPKNISELNERVENNQTILYDITPYFENGLLRIDVDYDCFCDSNDAFELPQLNFICEDFIVKNL